MRDGNDLMTQLVEATKRKVTAGGERYRLYKMFLEIFERDGYDVKRMHECMGLDSQFDDAYEYFYPREYVEPQERDCMDYEVGTGDSSE